MRKQAQRRSDRRIIQTLVVETQTSCAIFIYSANNDQMPEVCRTLGRALRAPAQQRQRMGLPFGSRSGGAHPQPSRLSDQPSSSPTLLPVGTQAGQRKREHLGKCVCTLPLAPGVKSGFPHSLVLCAIGSSALSPRLECGHCHGLILQV